MGFLNRFGGGNSTTGIDSVDTVLEYLEHDLEDPDIQLELAALITFMACVSVLRILSGPRLSALSGNHTLDLHALNDASMHKEVFLAYLNAALLEPVLAIAGMQEVVGQELVINLFTLGSICWWLWMVEDAFDYTDICQHFKYQVDLREEIDKDGGAGKYEWLQLRSKEDDSRAERSTLVGSFRRDIALWFCLGCIGAAWLPGIVSHRDVLHAYIIVILWAVLHHNCRRATTWSAG